MKTASAALALALTVSSAFAGLQYRFQTVSTTAGGGHTLSGTARVDGANMRLDIDQGDQLLIQDHSFLLSKDGGRTLVVANPADKTWYELKLDDLLGSAGSIFKQMGGTVQMTFDDEKVAAHDDGDGGMIAGYPTRKSSVTCSYQMKMNVMGQKIQGHIQMQSQTWATDKLPAAAASFVQSGGFRTGIEAIDKLIQAQGGVVTGFPLKQVITTTTVMNDQTTTMTNTTSVTDIHKDAVHPAGTFEMPAGYSKGLSPLETLTRGILGKSQ
jgi:hypothetical protein